jgi:hypothetical protein
MLSCRKFRDFLNAVNMAISTSDFSLCNSFIILIIKDVIETVNLPSCFISEKYTEVPPFGLNRLLNFSNCIEGDSN